MSKTKFITLGTAGGPTPKPYRMPPAHAIAYEGGTILVDCGEGAFQQLRRAGFDLKQVRELFITHHHFDHIGSLFACLGLNMICLLYTSPSPRDATLSRMPSSA